MCDEELSSAATSAARSTSLEAYEWIWDRPVQLDSNVVFAACISAAYEAMPSCDVCLSVCLSVCPYVTFVYCIKTSKRNIIPLSPSGSHTILVLQTKPYGSIQTGTPNGDVECRVYEKIAIFDQYIALFRTRYHCYYGTLTWSRMRSIERCHFQWPWMTRNPDFNVTPLSQNISEAVRDREL